jgi:hypothetical protein
MILTGPNIVADKVRQRCVGAGEGLHAGLLNGCVKDRAHAVTLSGVHPR